MHPPATTDLATSLHGDRRVPPRTPWLRNALGGLLIRVGEAISVPAARPARPARAVRAV